MYSRNNWLVVAVMVLLMNAAFAVDAVPKKKNLKKEPPQLAGFAMLPQKHTCQLSYEGCVNGCKSASGAGCAVECEDDCNVCSLDFGEDAASVCKK